MDSELLIIHRGRGGGLNKQLPANPSLRATPFQSTLSQKPRCICVRVLIDHPVPCCDVQIAERLIAEHVAACAGGEVKKGATPKRYTIATVLCDSGIKYLTKIYNKVRDSRSCLTPSVLLAIHGGGACFVNYDTSYGARLS